MKRGTKEPEGSEDWPTGLKNTDNPCWWSESGHTDPSFGVRPKRAVGRNKFRENYDKIKWERDDG